MIILLILIYLKIILISKKVEDISDADIDKIDELQRKYLELSKGLGNVDFKFITDLKDIESEYRKIENSVFDKIELRNKNNLQQELKETEQQAQKTSESLKRVFVWLQEENREHVDSLGYVPSKYADIVNGKIFKNLQDFQNTITALNRVNPYSVEHGLAAPSDLTDTVDKIKNLPTYTSITEKQINALNKEQDAILETVDAKNRDKLSTQELIDAYEKLLAINKAIYKLGGHLDIGASVQRDQLQDYLSDNRGVGLYQKNKGRGKGKSFWYNNDEITIDEREDQKNEKDYCCYACILYGS